MFAKRIFFFLLILTSSSALVGQNWTFQEESRIKGRFTSFSVDNFGRIHLCQKDVITQLSKELDTLFTSSLKSIYPTSIESRKSFRTLLFDSERSSILFLDNTLTPVQEESDLVLLGIQQPILVAESFNGNAIWVLDAANMRLLKLNDRLEIIKQTENLNNLFNETELPAQMLEANDFLYILLPNKGIAVFDIFGSFSTIIQAPSTSISVWNNHLFSLEGKSIVAYNAKNLHLPEATYTIPDETQAIQITQSKTYLLQKNRLLIGKFLKSDK